MFRYGVCFDAICRIKKTTYIEENKSLIKIGLTANGVVFEGFGGDELHSSRSGFDNGLVAFDHTFVDATVGLFRVLHHQGAIVHKLVLVAVRKRQLLMVVHPDDGEWRVSFGVTSEHGRISEGDLDVFWVLHYFRRF